MKNFIALNKATSFTALLLMTVLIIGFLIQPLAIALAEPINLSNNAGPSFNPQIAATASGSDNNVYVVWVDTTSGDNQVLFARSNDTGVSFEEPITLGSTISDPNNARPQLAVISGSDSESDNVYATWIDSGAQEVFFANSTDSGTSFATNPISDTEGSSNPRIVAFSNSGNNVFIGWEQSNDIFLASSADSGNSFEKVNVSNNEGSSFNPQIAATASGSDNNVYVVWVDTTSGDNQVLFARSNDTGVSFEEPITLGSTVSGAVPQVGASGTNVYASWIKLDSGTNKLFFAASSDSGETFGAEDQVSDDAGFALNPQMAVSENGVYLLWQDNAGMPGIFFTKSENGIDFADPLHLGNIVDGGALELTVLQGGGTSGSDAVYAVWQNNQVVSGNNQIFTSSSSDGGGTFGCSFNLGDTAGISGNPAILASDSNVYAVWSDDDSAGNKEILLVTNPDYATKSISIDSVDNTVPRWGIDPVTISGSVINVPAIGSSGGSEFSVTINWGDGSESADVPLDGCSWGPVQHIFESPPSSETGLTEVNATLVSSSAGNEGTSPNTVITLTKHFPGINLNAIASVKQGENVTITGILYDSDTEGGPGIGDAQVLVDGPGTGELAAGGGITVTTDSDGSFSASVKTLDVAANEWAVQAHFAGDNAFFSTDSSLVTYDTAASSATEFNVTASEDPVDLVLTGFNATVHFDSVSTSGKVFVSSCDAPESDRYVALAGKCLDISLGLMPGATTRVTMSYDTSPVALPDGHGESEVDLFKVDVTSDDTTTVQDITETRDMAANAVTGNTLGFFSKFVVGIALHDTGSFPEGIESVNPQIYVGSNEVFFRDIAKGNSSATSSIGDEPFESGQTRTLTITDANADLDPHLKDTVSASLSSNTSAPAEITLSLTETDVDSGVFTATFVVRSTTTTSGNTLEANAGDTISVHYLQSSNYDSNKSVGARIKAVLDGVNEAGLVQISDYEVNVEELQTNACFAPVTNAVNMTLVDAREDFGTITMNMSYANAIFGGNPEVFRPEFLQMYHQYPDSGWEILTRAEDVDAHSEASKTVVNFQPLFGGGLFVLGFDTGCTGGSGGGLARPGTGLVLDFVAPLVKKTTSSGSSGGGGGGGGGGSTVTVQETHDAAYFEENPLAKFSNDAIAIVAADGATSNSGPVHSGDEVKIQSTISNHQSGVPQPYTWIVQVVDKNGATVSLEMQEGSLDPGQSATLSILWTAEGEPGMYTIHMFTWDAIGNNPSPLSEGHVRSLQVQGT